MASRVVIHIGLEKTGTTSIQRYLEIRAHKLIKEGFLYPQAGRVGGGHHNLAFALGFSTLNADPHILDDLKVEIGRWPHQVILSSENFSIKGGKSQISSLRNLLEPLAERIIVVMYYRPRQEWLRSLYIERRRWGLNQEFFDFCRDIVPVYEALPDVWHDAFPSAALVVRRYDRSNNVIRDFTDLLGLPRCEHDEPHIQLNETPMEKFKDQFGEHPESDGNAGSDDWGWESVWFQVPMKVSPSMQVFQPFLRKGPMGLWDRIKGRLFNNTAPEKRKINRSKVRANPIIVYQMGRVGSNSIKVSLERAYRSLAINTQVLHGHYLNNFEELEKRAKTDLEDPTNFMRDLLSVEKTLRQSMMQMREDQRLKLITLVRDPVARNVSTFCFALNAFIPGWGEKLAERELTIDELHRIFLSKRAYVLSALNWFEEQMEPVFDIDVYATPFPIEKGYNIYSSSKADLLLLRLESLDHCAQEAFWEFLGLPNFTVSKINRGEDLKTGELYQLFKKKALPEDYIKWTYSFGLARHFYTDDELKCFTTTWTQNAGEVNKDLTI